MLSHTYRFCNSVRPVQIARTARNDNIIQTGKVLNAIELNSVLTVATKSYLFVLRNKEF